MSRRMAGYAFALGAGALWGTTGPLSTALYAEGEAITGIGFWRILLGTLALVGRPSPRRSSRWWGPCSRSSCSASA